MFGKAAAAALLVAAQTSIGSKHAADTGAVDARQAGGERSPTAPEQFKEDEVALILADVARHAARGVGEFDVLTRRCCAPFAVAVDSANQQKSSTHSRS